MKKWIAGALAVMALAAFASPARAITIDGVTFTDIGVAAVGSEDTFMGAGNIANSNPVTEANWIASVLGIDASALTYTQLDNSGGEDGAWLHVVGESSGDLWAWDFGSSAPAYFLIKTGNSTSISGASGAFNVFLYQNLSSLQYGVIDLDDYYFTNGRGRVRSVDIFRVSHVGQTGTSQVPEPGTLLLLGSGLLGLSLMRRRRE